jgi:signal transduction histidine kinase
MAGWVGTTIEARPVEPMTGLGFRAVADGERWRHVGFVLINVIIGSVIGNVGLVGYTIALQAIPGGGLFGFDFDPNPFTGFSVVFSLTVAAVVLGAAPRIAVFIARFKAQITQWFLGIDELEVTRQRVDTLSTQRDDILDAVAGERRRIERNLHDGVQQQLVAIGLDLGMAEQSIEADPERTRELITNAREKVRGSIGELRQLGRGLHPAVLADRGIDAALSAVVAGAPIPISVHVADDLELPTDVAETAYFVANEAVANVLKHSEARVASIQVTRVAANVRIAVHDDGVGGVDPSRGSGIAGIRARVQAVDGTLTISSPPGGPTMIVAEVPRNPPNNRDEGQIDG